MLLPVLPPFAHPKPLGLPSLGCSSLKSAGGEFLEMQLYAFRRPAARLSIPTFACQSFV